MRCAARRWLTANVFGCFERFLIGEETESDRLLHKRLVPSSASSVDHAANRS